MTNDTNATTPSQLMAKPLLSWDEFWQGIVGIPDSTAALVARETPAPKFFLLGRRRYIRTADARTWIDQRADAAPYFPRRNKRGAA